MTVGTMPSSANLPGLALAVDLGPRPRILVIRRDNIGDLVLTTPTLSLLRRRFPDAHIAALVNSYNAPVLSRNPDVNEVFAYTKAKHLLPGQTRVGAWFSQWRMFRKIRASRFDLAIVASPLPTPHWLRLARASHPRHVIAAVAPGTPAPRGVDLPVARDMCFEGRHAVEQTALLLTALGIDAASPPRLTLVPEAASLERHEQLWRHSGTQSQALRIGIHISARKPRQRWPSERFVELIRALRSELDCAFALFWAPGAPDDPRHPGDDDKADAILASAAVHPLLPMPTHTLDQLIAGLATIDVLICSDGGAMHLAAALGKCIVCFFGNSDPGTWCPWGVPHRVLRPESETVSDVTLMQTREAVLQLVAEMGLDRRLLGTAGDHG